MSLACRHGESYLTAVRLVLMLVGCAVALCAVGCDGCNNGGTDGTAPAVSASADPEGAGLVKGAVVAAVEKSGGVRLYKILKLNWFPEPMGEELEMIAYEQKGASFEACAKLWTQGKLTVALPKVRVAKHMFMRRERRIITNEPVTEAELRAKRGDPQRPPP